MVLYLMTSKWYSTSRGIDFFRENHKIELKEGDPAPHEYRAKPSFFTQDKL